MTTETADPGAQSTSNRPRIHPQSKHLPAMNDTEKAPFVKNSMFLRRLGSDPHANGAQTISLQGCPDILEIEGGDFAVIGLDITRAASIQLPPSVSCGPDERIVRIPRKTLILAKPDIPEEP